MCLSLAQSPLFKFPSKTRKKIIAYKVYEVFPTSNPDKLHPPYYGNGRNAINFKPGVVVTSNRSSTQVYRTELADQSIHKGIHVFYSDKEGKIPADALSLFNGQKNGVIVAVEGHKDKFVARSGVSKEYQMVFTEVKLLKILKRH